MDFPWRLKQRRADEHLRRFGADCDRYVAAANVGLDHETDADTGTIQVRLRADFEPPLTLGAIIGDVLHNLRSALDSVAWEACQVGPLTEKQEENVYFPIVLLSQNWGSARGNLPNLSTGHLEVFRQLQPWYWQEEARKFGVDVDPDSDGHPLVRLNQMARVDRHRVPHPVLARAGDTWLGTPEGVTVQAVPVNYWGARPGDVVLEWRVDPPGRVHDAEPAGDAILALTEEGALHRTSALDELQTMHQAVVRATQRVEIDVLGVVTPADIADLNRLRQASEEAEDALQALVVAQHVIDAEYIERRKGLMAERDSARTAFADRSRELFD